MEVDTAMPLPDYKRFLPDRKMMQGLVLRAMAIKDKEMEEMFPYVPITPWVRRTNSDIDI